MIRGVNLGNWLVLEKWMSPSLFEGTDAEDEYYLPRRLEPALYEARIRIHRSHYITERDFGTIASWGLNAVRIPVPYFVFGDVPPFIGCVTELDNAFGWAEHYGLKILIDLHTAPGGQNGFDNGGICGVCKWAQDPDGVAFVLSVLERLAERYGKRKGLLGIEILNEPNTETVWDTMKVTERYKPVDPEMAAGTAPVKFEFLYDFYDHAYDAIRKHADTDKAVVFHDGFDTGRWQGVMSKEKYKNVILDTHQYLMMAEMSGCEQTVHGYLEFIDHEYAPMIEKLAEEYPVIVGEWCLFNSLACGHDTKGGQSALNGVTADGAASITFEERSQIYRTVAKAQLRAWEKGAGWFYWSYKLLVDTVNDPNWFGWDAWDMGRCIDKGWFPKEEVRS